MCGLEALTSVICRRPDQWEDKWIHRVEPSEREKVWFAVYAVAQCIGELLKEARRQEVQVA